MKFQRNQHAVEPRIKDLNEEIDRLRVRYEQYFLGLERRAPSQAQAQLRSQLMELKRTPIGNTAIKFKLNTLWSRYLTFERMWQRTCTEIEEGRYHRDVYKARMREQARKEREAQEKAEDSREEGKPSAASLAAAQQADAQARRPAGISDDRVEKLYKTLVMAKKKCNEDPGKLSMDAVRKTLNKQLPELMKKSGGKQVDFKVVIKDGKAKLKPVLK